MTVSPDIAIALPARDEADLVSSCLASLSGTVRLARRRGVVGQVVVVVTAQRCSDETADVAARSMRRLGLTGDVVVDDALTVGHARDRAARTGLALLGSTDVSWVLSTDADTVVGEDWISSILAVAHRFDAASVVGLARLDEWRGGVSGLHAYNRLLRAKLHPGLPGDEHDHVYGANLAVRSDAYLAVGGFPDTPHGEDQQLVDTLAASGYRIARTCDVSVTTSGRTSGRADGGLADLLKRLDRDGSHGLPVVPTRLRDGTHQTVHTYINPPPVIQDPARSGSRTRLT